MAIVRVIGIPTMDRCPFLADETLARRAESNPPLAQKAGNLPRPLTFWGGLICPTSQFVQELKRPLVSGAKV